MVYTWVLKFSLLVGRVLNSAFNGSVTVSHIPELLLHLPSLVTELSVNVVLGVNIVERVVYLS